MTNELVRQMLEQIDSDYDHAITLRTMSATIGRQPAYLGRLFQQQVGSSVRNHLTRVRLEHAAALIRDGVKIEAVALCVGYRSKKNFYQRFKRHYGTTPVRYRRRRLEIRLAPESGIAPHIAADRDDSYPVAGAHERRMLESDVSAVPVREPGLGRLSSIVRSTNRAWRLAVRAQQLMLHHFTHWRVGALLTNDAGRYVCANQPAQSVTGYSMTELCDLSPNDVFVSLPSQETRCVWQLVLSRAPRPGQPANAMIRTKAGECVAVCLVTLKNVLWGRDEMSDMLERKTPLLAG